jgi:Ca2+-dependent lipid-binding protein
MGTLSTPGTLKILVIGAEELDKIVTAGVQQPYYIIECGKQRSRSKPCLQNGTNPHWNTAHKFELLDETAAVAVIKDEMTKGIIAEGLIDLSRCGDTAVTPCQAVECCR